MKNEPLFKFVAIAGLAGVVLSFAGGAPAGAAGPTGREVTRTGTYTTSRGGSGTASSVTTRFPGVVNRQGSWTNAAGGTGKWQSQAAWDKSTGTASMTGSATRPDGAKTTWQATATRTAPGVLTEKGTITTAGGRQETFTATRTRLAPGNWEKKEVITAADGKTILRTVDILVANGRVTRSVTITLPGGATVTRNASFTRAVSPLPAPSPTS